MSSIDLPSHSSTNLAPDADRIMLRRRIGFFTLVSATCLALFGWMTRLVGADGIDVFDALILAMYGGTLPWVVIGLWNAVIGVALIYLRRDWLQSVVQLQGLEDTSSPITTRTAIVMPVFNEDPERVFKHLRAVEASLGRSGLAEAFELFLLSDSNVPAIFEEEERRFEQWRLTSPHPERLHYRRRLENARQKVGNLESFCDSWGGAFDHMLVLDADSLMSGDAILRLVRLMQHNPRLGILQTLVVGLPAASAFARVFQFGMRHGMRTYTTGSAWWQGDSGPYWGHNAILRLAPFIQHCRLPRLPGEGPLGGEILSHDQVEAALMRAAGYEVRVLPIEGGSYEENPPTLPDFIKRDLRWCQGNIQYFRLISWKIWRPLGRLQLALAILMYLSPVMWMGFLLTGLLRMVAVTLFPETNFAFMEAVWERANSSEGMALFATMMTIVFAPKIFGVLDVMLSAAKRRRYGGGGRMMLGTVVELLFGVLLSPVIAVAQTVFVIGLMFGKRVQWNVQARDLRTVAWGRAVRGLWVQTLCGAVFAGALWAWAPGALPWATPLLAAWLLAVPFAVLTSDAGLGRWLRRIGLCAVPEELDPTVEVAEAMTPAPLSNLGPAAALAPTMTLHHTVPSRPDV
ncbi:glucans biosynthesis glucosyltransferase MdoH [Thalassobaculum sp.]|uniref:glucans biosynthesis glucosyltransferase MdoH n=1 Tax=Thalassobaculum sp. TaxID=2022740 RepID=UPI0032EF8042